LSRAQHLARTTWTRLPAVLRRWLVRRIEPKFLLSVVVIALDPERRVLCVRHVFRPRAHPWGLPSGFVRHGEAPEDAARREVLEETGFEIQVQRLLDTRLVQPDQLEMIYQARLLRQRPASSFETFEARVCRFAELPPGFLPSNVETLRCHGYAEATEVEP
jgi:ADP-ribose pyrophosphatase YjhB (NUDIX family)